MSCIGNAGDTDSEQSGDEGTSDDLIDNSDPEDDDGKYTVEDSSEGVDEEDDDVVADDDTEDSLASRESNKSEVSSDFESNNSHVFESELTDKIRNSEERSSDSDSPSIIPIRHPHRGLNQALDEDFQIMERVSPEPGM